jgi:hypothetical protein
MDNLVFLYKVFQERIDIRLSGDGVLGFAPLMAAGLVGFVRSEVVPQRYADGTTVITHTSHQLGLTQRGLMLVEAWRTGDEERYRKLLGGEQSATETPDQ